MEIEQTD